MSDEFNFERFISDANITEIMEDHQPIITDYKKTELVSAFMRESLGMQHFEVRFSFSMNN